MQVKRLILALIISSLLGCTQSTGIPLPFNKAPLHLGPPQPLTLRRVHYIVITKENAEAVFAKLEAKKIKPVLIGLTPDDYIKQSLNVEDIKQFLLLQQKIIILYKDYYEK